MPVSLPPIPSQPTSVPYFWTAAEWHWLGHAFTALHQGLGVVMATVQELQTALDANTAATAAAAAAIDTEIAQLAAAIAALMPGDPVTQAQLDQLSASTAKLSAATAALAADDPAAPPAV